MSARFVVGIDLGTTNTVVACSDTKEEGGAVHVFEVPQVVRAGEVRARPSLPSAIYLPAGPELAKDALALPWDRAPEAEAGVPEPPGKGKKKEKGKGAGARESASASAGAKGDGGGEKGKGHGEEGKESHAVGAFARDQGAEVPSRLVASAKSWLCHAAVDRKAPILPFGAPADVKKISPLEAQALILKHVAAAWDHAHAGLGSAGRLARQQVFLTVPASFDAAARELTLEAAHAAGLEDVTLLEEPQAAFYAWLHRRGDAWRTELAKGDVVLVCDVGGGTTDFSLISVGEEEGSLALERIAVGNHLLLGGDNMDLALAHVLAWRLEGQLDAWQSRALWHACQAAKEELFENEAKAETTVAVGGRGTRLVGGLVKGTLTRDDLQTIVVEGFFPPCAASDRPAGARRKAGFQELGLPFVADPAITKHLASFLGRHARPEDKGRGFVAPSFVLFNGGVMKATVLRDRLRGLLTDWAGDEVKELVSADLDLAVAQGAAYYGLVRRGRGIRIRGGAARSYYIGIESSVPAVPGMAAPLKALCVVPFGMEEGSEIDLPEREFGLLTGETAEFRFLGSTTRKTDRPGDLLERIPEDIEELDPIEAALEPEKGREQETVPVTLKARLTEVGTLDLFCVAKDRDRAWKLEYNVREQPDE